jgi:hypothetical protein
MSLLCRVVIGHFDAKLACCRRRVLVDCPLTAEEVERLAAVCEAVFGTPFSLDSHLTAKGTLTFESVGIKPSTYQVAAVARAVFGMSAVDEAHGSLVLPRNQLIPSREELADIYRRISPNWDEEQIATSATQDHEAHVAQARFESELLEQVTAFVRDRGG